MTKLPTQQGWSYLAAGNRAGLQESQVFDASGGALHQKLTGTAYGGSGYVLYSRAHPMPDSDFVLEAVAQISAEERMSNVSPYGLSFGVVTHYGYALIGIASDRWALYNQNAVAFNGFDTHTYRLVGHQATKTVDFWIDGVEQVKDFAMPQIDSDLGLFFADATGYTNTDASLLSYSVNAVPEPATSLLVLGVVPFLRRRKKA
ncbi:MAG: hypothetical protein KF857_02395 [Fimbriimonadaceae bacterium]|nr:hypothetical protein [Fimbriimonadaceae bacterium]